MNLRKVYAPPAIREEDEMEQTALQTCLVTEEFDGQLPGGSFIPGLECERFVQKNDAFGNAMDCGSIYEIKFELQPSS